MEKWTLKLGDFFRDSLIFCTAILIFLSSLSSRMLLNMCFSSTNWRKVLIQITYKTMVHPILKITWTEHHLPVLLSWENQVRNKIFTESSKQIIQFLHASAMWSFAVFKTRILINLFYKLQQRYSDLYLKNNFSKKISLIPFILTLVLVCSQGFLSDIVYRKIAVAFFWYLVMFKLNLELIHYHSILRLATNWRRCI